MFFQLLLTWFCSLSLLFPVRLSGEEEEEEDPNRSVEKVCQCLFSAPSLVIFLLASAVDSWVWILAFSYGIVDWIGLILSFSIRILV